MTGVPNASSDLDMDYSEELGGYIVTGIGDCEDLDIVIPTTYLGLPVVAIGEEAFYDPRGLSMIESITIIDGVETIGAGAFYGCASLKEIIILGGVEEIGEQAFFMCVSVETVVIPDSIRVIKTDGLALLTFATGTDTNVYYMGTEERWKTITIEDSYDPSILASVEFNYVYEG